MRPHRPVHLSAPEDSDRTRAQSHSVDGRRAYKNHRLAEAPAPVGYMLCYEFLFAVYPYFAAICETTSKPNGWVTLAKIPSSMASAMILKGFWPSRAASSLTVVWFETKRSPLVIGGCFGDVQTGLRKIFFC